jgi:hypothetical protein
MGMALAGGGRGPVCGGRGVVRGSCCGAAASGVANAANAASAASAANFGDASGVITGRARR